MTGADMIEANSDWLDDAMEGVMFGMRCIAGRSKQDGFPYVVFWSGNRHVQCYAGELSPEVGASIREQLAAATSRFGGRSISDMLPA